jgi:uncharacterized protein (UPF0332 family)
VNSQAGAFLDKSRELLDQANTMLGVNLNEVAGRTAYLAGLHAAQALIFESTGKIIKRHRGVQNELQRLTKDEPRFDLELRAFLGRTYNLKAIDRPWFAHLDRDRTRRNRNGAPVRRDRSCTARVAKDHLGSGNAKVLTLRGWRLNPLKGELPGHYSITVGANWPLRAGDAADVNLVDTTSL